MPGSDLNPEGDLGVQMYRLDDTYYASIGGESLHWDCREEAMCQPVS